MTFTVVIRDEDARWLREELLLHPETWAQGEIDYALRRLKLNAKRIAREAK